MNPDDDEVANNQPLKQPKVTLEALSKIGLDFINTIEERTLGNRSKTCINPSHILQAFAEDELVRREYREMRCEMPGMPRSTFLMVFSPDGTKVASTHGNHNIYVTDLRSGKNVKTLIGHPRTPWCIAFHPTSNQIVASGCLGGQVRIWDLSGGSEVWTAESPSVIASIAFHPNDRLLVIATYNELYFWDWSKPEPFTRTCTSNVKEKVRFVAFDKLGHKLITGIANTPQSRWERVRAPVPVPRQVDRAASPYRRRITPLLVNNIPPTTGQRMSPVPGNREPLSSVPERERRITACYRNLVHEYELLVHRYLQVYRPPAMIDQGTDPMEVEHTASEAQIPESSASDIQAAVPSTSQQATQSSSAILAGTSNSTPQTAEPTASGTPTLSTQLTVPQRALMRVFNFPSSPQSSLPLLIPSGICSLRRRPRTLIRGTQTHDTSRCNESGNRRYRPCSFDLTSSYHNRARNASPQMPTESARNPEVTDRIRTTSLPDESRRRDEGNSAEQQNRTVHHFINLHGSIPVSIIRSSHNTPSSSSGTQTLNPSRCLNINSQQAPRSTADCLQSASTSQIQPASESASEPSSSGTRVPAFAPYKMKIKCSPRRRSNSLMGSSSVSKDDNLKSLEEKLAEIQKRIAEKCNTRINDMAPKIAEFKSNQPDLPVNENLQMPNDAAASSPGPSRSNISVVKQYCDRVFSREHSADSPRPLDSTGGGNGIGFRIKRLYPGFLKKVNRRPVLETSSDSTSSDECEYRKKRIFNSRYNSEENANEASSSGTTTNIPTCESANNKSVSNFVQSPLENLNSSVNASEEQSSSTHCDEACRHNSTTCQNLRDIINSVSTSEISDSLINVQPGYSNVEELCTTTSAHPTPNVSSTIQGDTPGTPAETNHGCARTSSEACTRTVINTNTRTTNTTVYTSNEGSRRRFFSHRASAFHPTRINCARSQSRLRRSSSYLSPALRNRLRNLNVLEGTGSRLAGNFAPDELINYSERVNSEEDPPEQAENRRDFHPFDPPPELPSINPENIGIGNMYSNIVQDLESSLNNVRNIRASNRPGETSDMLSSFSERLESIMNQSDSILRNLRHTMNMLPNSERQDPASTLREPASPTSLPRGAERPTYPQFMFNDPNFYLREVPRPRWDFPSLRDLTEYDTVNQRRQLYSNRSAIASDHTYPRNPENARAASPNTDNMTPLMTSLHLTISHIQRQASLLRRQVESIERIDRAMLEVAQLQMIRQMFEEMREYLSSLSGNDSRSTGVSSVRQMMAGTRISDSSPCDSPSEDVPNRNPSTPREDPAVPETSHGVSGADEQNSDPQMSRTRTASRKTYPPSRLFRMQRQNRRLTLLNYQPRRYQYRDRSGRRHRLLSRSTIQRGSFDLFSLRSSPNFHISSSTTQLSSELLTSMTRRLEQLLTEQIRFLGRPSNFDAGQANPSRDLGEHILIERLYRSRLRMNRLLGHSDYSNLDRNFQSASGSVTQDGVSRFVARHTLSLILGTLSRYFEENNNGSVSQNLRSQIRGVIELNLLLSDILLLHIVDSIPPPSGMNLDPERESLSARIDQMCSHMLQNRLTSQSHHLTRSLRLMRLTARYASLALGQTYTARRNAMMPTGGNYERRRELLGQINNCLRNIHRRRGIPYTPVELPPMPSTSRGPSTDFPMREWYRTINELVSRYNTYTNQSSEEPSDNSSINAETGEETLQTHSAPSYVHANNSDDNDDANWRNNNVPQRNRPLYRTNNVNLLSNEDSSPSGSQNRNYNWSVPTVQINDVPISESNTLWQSGFLGPRYRLSELRSNQPSGLFRPRFLHPFYAGVNPFDADLDEAQREQIYDGDVITTVTPNHRIQVWDMSLGIIPNISNSSKNIVVGECKIHNDASVDTATDGTILVTLLPSGGYLNVTNRLGVYSLRWETLGQCLYTTSFEQNAVSVSLSPLSRYLIVGLASRRVSIMPSDKWTMARIFLLDENETTYGPYGNDLPVLRELEQNRETNYMSVNCIRWLPISGQGLIYATNTGQLRVLS